MHEYTYTQVRDEVADVGTALIDAGLAGAHVAIVGDNSYSYVICYLAVVGSGGVIVPLDKELTNGELADLIVRSGASALLYSDTFAAELPAILATCPAVGFTLNITRFPTESGNPGFDEFRRPAAPSSTGATTATRASSQIRRLSPRSCSRPAPRARARASCCPSGTSSP